MEQRPLSELLSGLGDLAEQKKEWNANVRAYLVDARRAASISQSELASAAGVTQPYLSQVENGHRSVSSDTLYQLTSAIEQVAQSKETTDVKSSAKEASRKARKDRRKS